MVVTRFAPSPTGYLHVGGARTALFNWLYARRTGGRFILRVEDTDQKRNTPTATQQVLRDLRWLGIDWDEGPDVGGPHKPYHQSQRGEIYARYVKQLLEQGKAYYCFDTPEELEALRAKAGPGFAYARPEQFPTDEDAARARAEGRPVAVRFAVPQDREFIVDDVIRGQVRFRPGEVGDFVIQKSDGFPTYHFAVVVDDELMGVTHVIRGQEHLMNTPAHLALQEALGFRTPVYAHMSVTVSPDGGKLSKRERPKVLRQAIQAMGDVDVEALAQAASLSAEDVESFLAGKSVPDMPAIDAMAAALGVSLPEINVVDFFRSGYLPETMVNFLALLGWNPGDEREVMDVQELIAAFELERLTKSNSLFDRKKLMSFNTEHIKRLPADRLLRHYRAFLQETANPATQADDATLMRILELCRGARTLAEIEQKCRFLFVEDDQVVYEDKAVRNVLHKHDGLGVLAEIEKNLKDWTAVTAEAVENLLRRLAEQRGVGLGKIAQPLRVALCGNTISPPIGDTVGLLGLDRTRRRIRRALEGCTQNP
ncbi:MAG TPA: glutamate--tRNA ligase [Phycisphaerales bacterium]|mgnify:CR=1 FL=1|nr:glutamate--tRNA ligase [Phycisphaerales bacterium]